MPEKRLHSQWNSQCVRSPHSQLNYSTCPKPDCGQPKVFWSAVETLGSHNPMFLPAKTLCSDGPYPQLVTSVNHSKYCLAHNIKDSCDLVRLQSRAVCVTSTWKRMSFQQTSSGYFNLCKCIQSMKADGQYVNYELIGGRWKWEGKFHLHYLPFYAC